VGEGERARESVCVSWWGRARGREREDDRARRAANPTNPTRPNHPAYSSFESVSYPHTHTPRTVAACLNFARHIQSKSAAGGGGGDSDGEDEPAGREEGRPRDGFTAHRAWRRRQVGQCGPGGGGRWDSGGRWGSGVRLLRPMEIATRSFCMQLIHQRDSGVRLLRRRRY
jgi:hypothetical protein